MLQSERHVNRVYERGCKEYSKDFTVALKMIDVFDQKQMYNSEITGKENASKALELYYVDVSDEFSYLLCAWLCMFHVYVS